MRVLILCFCVVFFFGPLPAQEIDPVLQTITRRLDSIEAYSARVVLEEDISFIDMPRKEALIRFEKGRELVVESDDFVLLPKRGLDLSLNELFRYSFITVRRPDTELDGIRYRLCNIIPTDERADFSIATLYMDSEQDRVAAFDITTREEGSFKVRLAYEQSSEVLPSRAEIFFKVDRLRIPLNFMGRDSQIDRDQLEEEHPKEGRVILYIRDYDIRFTGG